VVEHAASSAASRARRRRRLAASLISLGVAASAGALVAAEPAVQLSEAATATATADRIAVRGGLVSVSQSRTMTDAVVRSAQAAAAQVGAQSVRGSGYSVGLTWVRRGGNVVQDASAAAGVGVWQYPTSVTVLSVDALAALMGTEVQTAVRNGTIAMSQSAAALRTARVGDTIGLVSISGAIVPFTVGVVAPDDQVGGTEIVMSPEQARALGLDEITRVLIYGSFSRNALDGALGARGLVDGSLVRVVRSWDARSPDSTLGMVRTKQLFGEFAYRLSDATDGVEIEPAWVAAHLPAARETYASIAVHARCHVRIRADLQAALTEVDAAGLAGAIDVGNTNTFGGCYNPRFNRETGDLGFLSRHAWAQALDMNTVTNAQGRTPQMDCRVVRIFRKHNFAWGGNFLTPDGMHFEWVGEPRHTFQYPSEFCPNLPVSGSARRSEPPSMSAVMFADDGFLPLADH
jgi:hypothetical protein